MNAKDMPDFAALEALHDTLQLHEYHKLQCGIELCACGKENHDPDDELGWASLDRLRDVIDNDEVRADIATRLGTDLCVYLIKKDEARTKMWERTFKQEKRYLRQANDGSWHVKRKTPSQR